MTRFVFAAVAGAMIATSASAAPTIHLEDTRSVYVSYVGLNLQSDEGQSRLVHRIWHAADEVCVDRTDLTPFLDPRAHCYRTAVTSGMAQMDEVASR